MRLNWWWLAPALVLGALGATISYKAAVPERSDWAAAVDHVRSHLKAGDGVAWTPYWAGEGRLFLHELPAFHLPEAQDADLARFERVWLLGAFGRDSDDLPPGHTRVDRREFGGVTLDLVEVGGARVKTDLYERLNGAQVRRRGSAGVAECDFWDGRGWHCLGRRDKGTIERCLAESTRERLQRHRRRRKPHCGLDPWLNVSRDIRVIGAAPRRCVWVHPVAGKEVVVRLPETDFGNELVFKYGFTDKVISDHYRDTPRTRPVRVRISRDQEQIGERVMEPLPGWFVWRLPTPAGKGEVELAFETDVHLDAHLCIDVTTRESRP